VDSNGKYQGESQFKPVNHQRFSSVNTMKTILKNL